MNMSTSKAREVIFEFLEAYLTKRDPDAVLSTLAREVHWVGTGISELAAGREAVEQLLQADLTAEADGFDFECRSIAEELLPGGDTMFLIDICIMQGAIAMDTRMTVLCTLEDGAWKIASLHGSTAERGQDEGAFFPSPNVDTDQVDFAHTVGLNTLDLLEKNICGGILGTYIEPDLPLYYINSRMLEYLGYESREEFIEATDGFFINCIPPAERERVRALAAGAFDDGEEYDIQYPICKRSGETIWVKDIGRQGIAEDGRTLCISVIRDITAEIERSQLLELEATERARQAKRYDQLYQSVLCGIVQYRLDETGNVVFENANREAIRLFGYQPDEFWAKKDWHLPDLVAEEDRDRVLRGVKHLRRVGDKGSYEYRLRQKDGTSCWIIGSVEIILNSEGVEVFQSVYLDIDSRKQAELRNRLLTEQVEASNELLRLALEHTTTCECYYYPRKQLLVLPQRAQEYYGALAEYGGMPESFAEARVAAEFRNDFCELFRRIGAGERTDGLEFRIRGSELWCRATFSVLQYTEEQEAELIVGVLEDITRQKGMEQALTDARSRDSLTGLYNRDFGVRLVQECLQQRPAGECYAMMLLDMDDFTRINEEEGSAFADALLQEVADVLSSYAGEDGICVRLGGDEFMLLLRDCNKAKAAVLGPQITAQVREIFAAPEKNLGISVSIGMCVTDVTADYASLYRCAESTLRYVKEHARGTAACYLDTSSELGILLTKLYAEEHPVNDIDRSSANKDEDLVSFALELLGKSKNLDDAVFLLFARIGKSLGLDRVSIVDANRDFLSYVCTYQWTRNRAHLQAGREFYVSAKVFDAIAGFYDEEGLSEIIPPADFSPLASILHAGIWNYGEYAGSMCFEVNQPGYQWSNSQRKLLKELVKIVPSFLMKAKADAVSRAKTDFLSRMSHEIRTPMNAISGMTTIAKNVLDDREKTLDCLEKIESANSYLLELINDILDMSRIESGKMELDCRPMDLAELLERLEALLRPQAQEKSIKLSFESDYVSNRPLIGDTLRLNQVLINIIGNAIKFTPEGGEVLVRVEQREAEPKARLRFSVRDTGVGIEAADTKRIFNAFEQSGRSLTMHSGGTGLGLAISSRLVQLMGGQLEVKSTVGAGSDFFFTLSLPYANALQPVKDEPSADLPQRDFSGLRLLVAEDNELNLEIAKGILEMHGFNVVCARNGVEAVATFTEAAQGHFDAILMDIRMPLMDGLEATRQIRTSEHPDARSIPIIALTANAFDEDSRKSMDNGMNGHLSKPIQIDRLLETLDRCLQRE